MSPGFTETYDAFLAEWNLEPETPPYLALAEFSRHIISLLQTGDRQQLHAAFEAIEWLHANRDAYVREATTIGILESLRNTNLHTTTTPDQFIEFLHPVSLRYGRKVEDFWENGTNIIDDWGRAKEEAKYQTVARGAAGREGFQINVARRGPVYGVVMSLIGNRWRLTASKSKAIALANVAG